MNGAVHKGTFNTTFVLHYSDSTGVWTLLYGQNEISSAPTCPPTTSPTSAPSSRPTTTSETNSPTSTPSANPTRFRSAAPSFEPSSEAPSTTPSFEPSSVPSSQPTVNATCLSFYMEKNCNAGDWSKAKFYATGPSSFSQSRDMNRWSKDSYHGGVCPQSEGVYSLTVQLPAGNDETPAMRSSVCFSNFVRS